MYVFLVIVHVVVCLFLIAVVLLQTGKRADLAGAFGGGGSQTAFGARGAATMLSKATTISAIVFMVLAFVLSMMSTESGTSGGTVLDEAPASQTAPAPKPESPPALPQLPPADKPAPSTPAPQGN